MDEGGVHVCLTQFLLPFGQASIALAAWDDGREMATMDARVFVTASRRDTTEELNPLVTARVAAMVSV